jgi:hypothetical protein
LSLSRRFCYHREQALSAVAPCCEAPVNLRRYPRFPVRLSSVVTGPTSDESAGMTVNLSKQGCLIEADSQLETGMLVTLRINVPGEASPIRIERATVRWNLVGKMGLGFLAVDSSEQRRLDQLLERMNRDQST